MSNKENVPMDYTSSMYYLITNNLYTESTSSKVLGVLKLFVSSDQSAEFVVSMDKSFMDRCHTSEKVIDDKISEDSYITIGNYFIFIIVN